jgi:hypothetical protein
MTFDEMNLEVARRIDDYPSGGTASSNGDTFTASQRIDWLNQACRDLHLSNIKFSEDGLSAEVINPHLMRAYITDEAQSLTASQKILSEWTGGVAAILSAWNVTTGSLLDGTKDSGLVQNAGAGSYIKNSASKQYYTIQGGYFVLIAATANATDSIKLSYVIPYTDLVAGGTILFPAEYHSKIVDEAVKLFYQEYPSLKNIDRLKVNG